MSKYFDTKPGSLEEAVSAAQDIVALIQWGPKTGAPVFRDDYSDGILSLIHI